MDGQAFLNHIFRFFDLKETETGHEVSDADAPGAGSASSTPGPGCPDLPVLAGLLLKSGFRVSFSDKGERGGSSDGCRAIFICKRSGTRVVMDGDGPCTCPSDAVLHKHLHSGSTGQAPSRAPSPTPSTVGQLEDPLNTSMSSSASCAAQGDAAAPPRLSRQRTWNRDGDQDVTKDVASPHDRRLSAPPASFQSPWTTLQGDDLNVMAAKDLINEALSLLSGVKKVNLRNTPVVPVRRPSAASRRLSHDTFVQPLRPISRTSSTSSGLGSVKSTSSSHADTPRPLRPAGGGGVGTMASRGLRRSVSVNAGTVKTTITTPGGSTFTPSGTPATPGGTKVKAPATSHVLNSTKSDPNKKGPAESSTGARSLIAKVSSHIKPPSTITKGSIRAPPKVGIKTNASFSMAKTVISKTDSKSPEVESIKL